MNLVSFTKAHIHTKPEISNATGTLSQIASALCDKVYNTKFVLRNELINRQSVSNQMARARGEIVLRMLKYRENAANTFQATALKFLSIAHLQKKSTRRD